MSHKINISGSFNMFVEIPDELLIQVVGKAPKIKPLVVEEELSLQECPKEFVMLFANTKDEQLNKFTQSYSKALLRGDIEKQEVLKLNTHFETFPVFESEDIPFTDFVDFLGDIIEYCNQQEFLHKFAEGFEVDVDFPTYKKDMKIFLNSCGKELPNPLANLLWTVWFNVINYIRQSVDRSEPVSDVEDYLGSLGAVRMMDILTELTKK